MRSMTLRRCTLVAALMAAALPGRVAAQGKFEGIITLSASNPEHTTLMTIWVKNPQVRTQLARNGQASVTYIVDRSGRFLRLMDMHGRKLYMVMPSEQASTVAAAAGSGVKYVATGQSETVAGHPCKYYQILDPNGFHAKDIRYCVTTALGFIDLDPSGGVPAPDKPEAHQQFEDGYFVLKTVKVADGKDIPQWEVTKIEPATVSDTMFVVPAGYTEMRMPGHGGLQDP